MNVSKIELLGSTLLKISGIQSARQLGSYVAATLIGFMIFQAGIIFLGEPMASPIILLFAFSGSSVLLRMTLPARFCIVNDSSERCVEVKNFLAQKLKKQGYHLISKNVAEAVFQSKLPAFLRWSENEITITKSDATLMIKGPVFMIRMLHKYSSGMLSA